MAEPILYPYQRRWLQDSRRFKVGTWARQTGKTFTCTLEICLDCLTVEAGGSRTRWVILSRGERQAREAMEEGVKRHLHAQRAVFEVCDHDWSPSIKAAEVALPGGSRITALPANPDTARGYSANTLLDEFAFHQDSHAIWRSLFPVISRGHRLRVVSTPNGKGNKFYELMTDPSLDGVWSRHVVDIYTAVAEGLPRDIEELRRGMNDPEGWAQEFELQWIDDATAWLPYDLIDACSHPDAGDPARYAGGWCWVGMDIAARGDLTVITVLEESDGLLWCREMIELRRASFADQLGALDRVMASYRVVRAAIDQTGMGEMPVEEARRRHGSRIEGVLFTSARRLDLATALREAMEDRRLRIPARPELRADLHSVTRSVSPTGAPRLGVERTDSHADRFWSLALAVGAAHERAVPIEYHALGRARPGLRLGGRDAPVPAWARPLMSGAL